MSWRKVSGVLCNKKLSAKVKGKMYKSVVGYFMEWNGNGALWNGNGGSDRKTDGKNGSCRVENGVVGTGSDKKGQDKKRIHERDCKNCKAGRQTLECKATLVWTCEKERRRLHGERMVEMVVPGRRKRGRPRRWMDLVREDMERVGAREGDEVD